MRLIAIALIQNMGVKGRSGRFLLSIEAITPNSRLQVVLEDLPWVFSSGLYERVEGRSH
ncbi:hypothetical protein [Nostoc sp. C117]|uniref:hypothetical protein n=1 Tax=Nostoc sp. C117 TaxID=3349875 RepID=UPI00370D043A